MIKKKFKVALITNIPTPYRVPLFKKINENPLIDLFVYFTAKSEENREWFVDLSDKFNYKFLPVFTLRFNGKDLFSYHINPSIILELIKNDYDVVISAGYASLANQVAIFLCKIKKIPIILWSGSTINEPSLKRVLSLPLVKLLVKLSDAFIAYGSKSKDYLIKLKADQNRIFISYNSCDTDFFLTRCSSLVVKENNVKSEIGINSDKIILFVGQLIERKNIKTLIKAFLKLKNEVDVSLLIVGEGVQKIELKKFCIENKIDDVHFLGFTQSKDLPKYYNVSDLLVLPSSEEVWGLVLNEAMACGLPVIASDKVGASEDLIKNGENGYIFSSKNVEQLYTLMRDILLNPVAMNKMKIASKKKIEEKFNIAHAADGFFEAIFSLA